MNWMDEEIDVLEEVLLEEKTKSTYKLVLYNDDVNTFDWVIDCLMKYCKNTQEQAEQNAWFVHFKGKAIVKSGEVSKLKPMCEALCENGLSAKVEEN